MGKIHALILTAAHALTLVSLGLLAPRAVEANPIKLFVDPVNGSAQHAGDTPEQAFRTIEQARDHIRANQLNVKMSSDVIVSLRGGRYELTETLVFDSRDSGSNGFCVVYRNFEGEEPVLCGGKPVVGWTPVPGKPYFVADVPEAPWKDVTFDNVMKQDFSSGGYAAYFRQLYVNGVRATVARTNTTIWSSRSQWWDDLATPERRDGIYVRQADIQNYAHADALRILWLNVFKCGDSPVAAIVDCDTDEKILRMRQPGFNTWASWGGVKPSTHFFVSNALEELDEPGEWYLDQEADKVYYYPYKRDHAMEDVEAYVPRIDTLMRIDGFPVAPVHHLRFEGLTFQHGNWLDQQHRTLGRSQAEIDKFYHGEIPGQIVLDYADDVVISGCTVRHLGSCGIQLYEGCHRVLVEGNTCYDLTAAAITIGRWFLDKRNCVPETVCTDTMVRNNIVRNTGRDYLQATGINIFAAFKCKVYHNDISDIAYTAIHARIGNSGAVHDRIGKIEYKCNKVSRGFAAHKWGIRDGGHLYLHGRYPGSVVSENYSLYANPHVNCEYYSDNYSHTVLWTRNVSRYSHAEFPYRAWHHANVDVVFDGNYCDHPQKSVGHGKLINHHVVSEDSWPMEAERIMENAGLEPAWRHLSDRIYGHENVAFGKPCWASSENGELMAARAGCDDDWKTFWHTKLGGDGQAWWKVDLGKKYVIQRITIIPRQDLYQEHAHRDVEVQASNDREFGDYVVLAEQNDVPWYNKSRAEHSTNMWEKYLDIPEAYRYVRVKANNRTGTFSFAEFAVYGYEVR